MKRKRYVESKIRGLVRRLYEELHVGFIPHGECLEGETADHFFMYTSDVQTYEQVEYVQYVLFQQVFVSWRNSEYAKYSCGNAVDVQGRLLTWQEVIDVLETIPSYASRAAQEKKKYFHTWNVEYHYSNLFSAVQNNVPFSNVLSNHFVMYNFFFFFFYVWCVMFNAISNENVQTREKTCAYTYDVLNKKKKKNKKKTGNIEKSKATRNGYNNSTGNAHVMTTHVPSAWHYYGKGMITT
ncbi:hypothetical protein RFI_14919 [Reticulomyxa filosa]|uniref:Uncharacterized protein n=1 Tax=Reticulomyxa filosa TaxID=46433 RepID=X6N7L2_RETFI|nr:hypothetical protein RFI_14919 [Reticulomyxa filosa]|eukprot:ETO22280.1 hypothetical protein RFI_14919 [Reticulomyxa filosa]